MESTMKKVDFKRCLKCGEEKPASAEYFYADASRSKSFGFHSWCKDCLKLYNKKYRQENKKKRAEYMKKYRQKKKKEIAGYAKKFYEKNKEKIATLNKRNRKIKREYDKLYRERNKNTIRKKERIRHRKNWCNPIHRLLNNMRGGLYHCLCGITKTSSSLDYVGLTADELMEHLEAKFTEGMTRENYGKWHVDHIRPLASFDFTGPDKEKQLYKAWNYTNLQPLWASENQSKGAKYEEG